MTLRWELAIHRSHRRARDTFRASRARKRRLAGAFNPRTGAGPGAPRHGPKPQQLGGLYCGQGRYTEGALLFERALRIFEQALGPDHPNVAARLESYAFLLKAVDRPEEAAPLEARARAIRAKHVN